MTQKNYEKFLEDLGILESSNRYNVSNPHGYLGRYQMGEAALIDAGYYEKKSKNYNNDWKGTFTGKDGIYSKKDFLNSPKAQNNAIKAYHENAWKIAKSNGMEKYIGQTRGGIKITKASIIAGYHNQGSMAFSYIKSNGKIDKKDGNGTPVSKYLKEFADYDVSDITDNKANSKELKNNTPKTLEGRVEKQAKAEISASRQDGESRIDYFTRRIRESMEQSSQKLKDKTEAGKSKALDEKTVQNPLKQMLASQKEKLSNIKEKIFNRSLPLKRMHGDVPKDYQNKFLKDKKIFTREQIEAMEPKEKQELQDAIKYQNDTIGVPDEKQAKKLSQKSGSGLIYVSGYTRSDGTPVKSYYRTR